LLPLWESQRWRRLVEPFCGGLAVALGLQPKTALLNDINPHLINFYDCLRQGLVVEGLRFENKSTSYYASRVRFNKLLTDGKASSPEAAALFYYLNRTGYNGLCRFNQGGGFNVPFGSYVRINYKYDFSEYADFFTRWEFTNKHFSKISLRPDDFVYADPPYDVEFRQYSKDGFGWDEQVATAEFLAKHSGPVVLSNQATERILELYGKLGYHLIELEAPRRISCTGDRTPAPEVLAVRNLQT
jgi:DNA adenine methylase